MKLLQLIMWVGQFGFSVMFPFLVFLMGAAWLRQRFGLGLWVMVVFGILGLLTSVSTAKSCLHSMRKLTEDPGKETTTAFNDHS